MIERLQSEVGWGLNMAFKSLCLLIFMCSYTIAGPFPNFHSDIEFLNLDQQKEWWQTASLYQIYPRSFKDSDADGIGDLNGITDNLEYLKEIGITGTWLSPIFKSPMKDFGYDISDFYNIQDEYGTMEDFDRLLEKAKKLGIKILLDFVPNHSSDQCEWFKKSVKKEGKYKDYYVWHPGKVDPNNATNRLPPSNWISVFRKSAWQWNDERKEFYFHQFTVQQPDLNYRNPDVVEEMKNVLRFWLNKGVDGYRIDAVPHLFEIDRDSNGNFADEPRNEDVKDPDDYGYLKHIYTVDQPETIDMVYQWRAVLDEHKATHGGEDRIILAETYSPLDIVMKYYGDGKGREGAQIPFNFQLITSLSNSSNAFDYENIIMNWMNKMPKGRTANWVLGNHDKSRVGSRLGSDRIDALNMLLLTLPGVSVNYNGEEIGMTDVWISWKDTVDPSACNSNPDIYQYFTRDPERTPFQWDNELNAGFSKAEKTWLPVGPNYKDVNVDVERPNSRSHLNVYKDLQELRKTDVIKYGDMVVKAFNKNVLAVLRFLKGEASYVTLININDEDENVDLTKEFDNLPEKLQYKVVGDHSPHKIGDVVLTKNISLKPKEAVVLETEAILTSIMGYFFYNSN